MKQKTENKPRLQPKPPLSRFCLWFVYSECRLTKKRVYLISTCCLSPLKAGDANGRARKSNQTTPKKSRAVFCHDFMIHLRRRCPVIGVKLQSAHQDAVTLDLMSNKVSSHFLAKMSLHGNDEQRRRMRDAHLMFRQMFAHQHWFFFFSEHLG